MEYHQHQLLFGSGYEFGDDKRSTITVEHVNGWEYGDNYFFLDIGEPFDEATGLYAEWAPRLSLSKMTGVDVSNAIWSDLYLAGMLEFGSNLQTYLIGAGTNLTVPGFAFVEVDAYYRDDPDVDGSAFQVTSAWLSNFQVGAAKLQFVGFLDWSGAEGPKSANLLTQPKLLLDLGHHWGTPDRLLAGIEYTIWFSKFGTSTDEFVPQPMVKWTF